MISIDIDPMMTRGRGPRESAVFEVSIKQRTIPALTLTFEQNYPRSIDRAEETASGYNAWLASLPAEDWSDGVDPSEFREVEWVPGVGFIEKRM